MLAKQATILVHDTSFLGYYSWIFVVLKSTGGWRPIIDLSPLNKYVAKRSFKMETPASVRESLTRDDWLTSIDLKDTYFHVPIHNSSEPLLRFV